MDFEILRLDDGFAFAQSYGTVDPGSLWELLAHIQGSQSSIILDILKSIMFINKMVVRDHKRCEIIEKVLELLNFR